MSEGVKAGRKGRGGGEDTNAHPTTCIAPKGLGNPPLLPRLRPPLPRRPCPPRWEPAGAQASRGPSSPTQWRPDRAVKSLRRAPPNHKSVHPSGARQGRGDKGAFPASPSLTGRGENGAVLGGLGSH